MQSTIKKILFWLLLISGIGLSIAGVFSITLAIPAVGFIAAAAALSVVVPEPKEDKPEVELEMTNNPPQEAGSDRTVEVDVDVHFKKSLAFSANPEEEKVAPEDSTLHRRHNRKQQ